MSQPSEAPPHVVVQRDGQSLRGEHAGAPLSRGGHTSRTRDIALPLRRVRRATWHPALVFVYGFAGFIGVGGLILTLPIASAAGQWTPVVDALFTATSAVCVTGLVVLDTGTYWSGFGQGVILLLIQLGGLGFMTSST